MKAMSWLGLIVLVVMAGCAGSGGKAEKGAMAKDTDTSGTAGAAVRLKAAGEPIHVLYVERNPRWEFRFIKNALLRSETVRASTLLLEAEAGFVQEGHPREVDANGKEMFPGPIQQFPESAEELQKYDVLMIGDVEASYFTPGQQRAMVDFVEKFGGGIMWIAGPNFNPENYEGTLLEPLIPVTPREKGARKETGDEPFTMKLTEAGKKAEVFGFLKTEETKRMEDFPPMYWCKGVKQNPGAEVWAVAERQGGEAAPLLVTWRRGKGRVVFSAVCDTWRWRRNTGEAAFQGYWLAMCEVLAEGRREGANK